MGQDFTICFHFCCFPKGSLSWRLAGMFPHPCHTTCPGRQWSQKSSSLQLHLPCKGCQKTWFSPVVKLPRNSELPAAGIQTAGVWLKAWRSSFLEDEAELFLPLSGVGFGIASRDHCVVCQMEEMELSGSPGFQDFWKGHVVTWYLKPISSKSASNELKRVWSMEEARIPEGGHRVAFSRVRSCCLPRWVLQHCRATRWKLFT